MNSATMNTIAFGNPGGNDAWAGHRATKSWYGLFGDLGTSTDDRVTIVFGPLDINMK